MHQQYLDKWLEALRSGKYRQTVTLLRTIQDKYSALGVLCDLLRVEAGLEWILTEGAKAYTLQGEDRFLPPKILELTGTTDRSPTFLIHHGAGIEGNWRFETLLAIAEDYGYTLPSLANIIERGWQIQPRRETSPIVPTPAAIEEIRRDWFFHEPEEGFSYFATEAEAIAAANARIKIHLEEDGQWDAAVEQITVGKLTHETIACDRVETESGYDCNYRLVRTDFPRITEVNGVPIAQTWMGKLE
jgi:hypothetical protein